MTESFFKKSDLVRRNSEAIQKKARIGAMDDLAKLAASLQERRGDPEAWLAVAQQQCTLGLYGEAIVTLEQGIEECPPSSRLYRRYIVLLKELNRTEEAIEAAREARRHFPAEFFFRLKESLTLRVVYSDSYEVELYRRRYTLGLRAVAENLRVDTPAARESALEALQHHVNFLLAYQGDDDRELQTLYGGIAHRVMAESFPQWAQPLAMPDNADKLRIGYISAHLRQHSVSRTHLAWITEPTGDRFQIFAYYTGTTVDRTTNEARRSCAIFRHLPEDLDEACRTICADNLHVLVFLDIGLDGRMTRLAALRMAPVQCSTWGHPMTSGLPTIDYFLSSELMEPENGDAHYSEKLVRLPGIGVCYPQPVIPRALLYKTRADFGIRADATVYLSCQSPCKYLPRDDDIYPAITCLVPGAQFVFVARNDFLREDLQKRLDSAFATAGVDIAGRIVFVPHLDQLSYWNLNALSDICLDTLEWSGCNSTLDAIACKLPVVTLPGKFMRGRHTFAILTQLGVTSTIAVDKAAYIEIAARLAHDPEWRKRLVEGLVAGYSKIFSDRRSITALEKFYEQVTGGTSSC